ncbi:MAG: BNR repeat-containing protein [Armatimonadetes bacterium]|nr:BNR repeat-containing protein [Armatimonadota bacterium]
MLLALLYSGPNETVVRTVDIAPVWAGHYAAFDLVTRGDRQFVAFYDAQRQMTVGARRLDDRQWHLVRLPSRTGWDSHNYLALALDDEGLVHLSGNMHAVPLIYFRTTRPYDIDTFQRATPMVGARESRATYPEFFRGPSGELIFAYRDGYSGNGDQIYNVWSGGTHTWRRLLDQPLTDGEGQRNAYLNGPTRGPDGWWHLAWVWRETGDAATNHDLSYARSRDLVHWEKSDGTPLVLPIKLSTGEIVAPVPVHGGMINSNIRIGFDHHGRVVLSYHRFDAKGFTQVYNARRESDGWHHEQASDWDYRWDFSGGGSLLGELRITGVSTAPDGTLRQGYWHAKKGTGVWRLDETTLRPIGLMPPQRSPLDAYSRVEGTFPGLVVRWLMRDGSGDGTRYGLRWETLPANRDQPRPQPWPGPSMLRLYELGTAPVRNHGRAASSLW